MESNIIQGDYQYILEQIGSNSTDLILTDPPYTISKKTGFQSIGENSVKKLAVNMDFGEWDWEDIDLKNLSELSYDSLKKSGTAIIWYDVWKISHLADAMRNANFKQLRVLIWEKTNPVPLNQSVNYLNNGREMAVLGVKGGKPTFHEKYHTGLFRYPIPRDGGKRIHPTQKSLKLFSELVSIHSNEGDLVSDPFLGSGTTALAALSQSRNFFGGEIDPKYVKASKNRINKELNI